jgi:hypothetical protein
MWHATGQGFGAIGLLKEKSSRAGFAILYIFFWFNRNGYLDALQDPSHRGLSPKIVPIFFTRVLGNDSPSCIRPNRVTRGVEPVIAREHFWAAQRPKSSIPKECRRTREMIDCGLTA